MILSEYIFDDGSLESKVLQQEIKAQVIKVDSKKLSDWLSLISETGITKVYLHFCYEDYTPGLRAEIHTALRQNPNLRIICQYENNPKRDIEKKAIFKAIKHTEIASDTLKPVQVGGHEELSHEFVDKLIEVNKDKIKIVDYGEIKTAEDAVKAALNHGLTEPKTDYGKYSVGGNDSLRSEKVTRNEDIDKPETVVVGDNPGGRESISIDPFTKKYNEFKEKRRRKKK